MKKHSFIYFLVIVVCLSVFPIIGNAAEVDGVDVIYLEDGSYIVTELSYIDLRALGSKNGQKKTHYYDGNDVLQWTVILSGSFTYDGTSSTCTSATASVIISDSSWYTVSKSATKSGNTATGTFSIGERLLGVMIQKIPVSITLSCDKNGNLS